MTSPGCSTRSGSASGCRSRKDWPGIVSKSLRWLAGQALTRRSGGHANGEAIGGALALRPAPCALRAVGAYASDVTGRALDAGQAKGGSAAFWRARRHSEQFLEGASQ
jgi:hypothetical protein